MGEYKVVLSDEEEKALLTDMVSIQTWLENLLHNKARQCTDRVCERALQEPAILTDEEKQGIVSQLAAQGRIITTVKHLPESLKAEIVQKARVESAAERQERLESENSA